MRKKENPCYKCTDRKPTACHATCAPYKEWKDDHDERQRKIRDAKAKQADADAVAIRRRA